MTTRKVPWRPPIGGRNYPPRRALRAAFGIGAGWVLRPGPGFGPLHIFGPPDHSALVPTALWGPSPPSHPRLLVGPSVLSGDDRTIVGWTPISQQIEIWRMDHQCSATGPIGRLRLACARSRGSGSWQASLLSASLVVRGPATVVLTSSRRARALRRWAAHTAAAPPTPPPRRPRRRRAAPAAAAPPPPPPRRPRRRRAAPAAAAPPPPPPRRLRRRRARHPCGARRHCLRALLPLRAAAR